MTVAEVQGAAVATGMPRRAERQSPDSGAPRLEDAILGTWEELGLRGRACCPVCGGELRRDAGCSSCGSALS